VEDVARHEIHIINNKKMCATRRAWFDEGSRQFTKEHSMQSKEQLIESIQRINPSALREFLTTFDWQALRRYLDHLSLTLEPRGVDSHWTRLGDTPAVVWRRSAA